MKKALIVTNLIGFVGFLWNDIGVLQSLGYQVEFASNADDVIDQDVKNRFERESIEFHRLHFSTKNPFAKQNLTAYLELRKLLEEGNYDLLHCHTPIAGFIARLAAVKYRKKGTKVIYTTHGFAFTRYSSRKQWLMYYNMENLASCFTDTIITINREDYENAQKMCCKDVRHINGVGVNTAEYHDVEIDVDAYKRGLGLPTDKIMVLSVGELSDRKNHQVIIKAISRLENKSEYIYVICGKEVAGSQITDALTHLAEECGVELYLMGHRSDIPQVLHCSDIGAIPSVREGLGLAGVQSLCAQVPLVGTRVQGIQEYILDGISGYLCEPYDDEGFAEAIRKLSDEKHRSDLKANCYEIAKRFDVSIAHDQMKHIYMTVLCERGQNE